ncbi:MAG: phosphodiester glycosidase family protein [Rhodobacter sp.]|uniref:phosphodiester glycosidase family protein n=1 Tax=Pararhodobacter sp. TaxID=2127056 RepID=UPI001E140EC8|nr:phosphodiester glycosidase family protein [Pararhodobacter sp.]MCB1345642.1 phosphodiester glycosidase family protein [Paracoccaceae bacterium]MCC0072196.1 phosphodiester glycosidase family protein [Rhodobacter sp.]HPD92876.1 phosphodiester glycosidase family protein [Pararhodobacter sp.]
MRRSLLALILAALATPAAGASCRDQAFEEARFTVCEAEAGQDLRLFLRGDDGQVYGSFTRIEAALEPRGERLAFAMNAGMFHLDRAPVGLYVEQGSTEGRLVTRAGPGNFGMLPNGVFCVRPAGDFAIVESRTYDAAPPDCRYATQSGPMLVIDGALHPRFLPDSTSAHLRNGVGVSADGQRAVFVISDDPVTFHRFARFFRDALGLNQALYLDGSVSRLYAPELGRTDWGVPMGPVVGLVVPRE